MLKAMPATSPYYAAAKRAMADIYLKHRKDKRASSRGNTTAFVCIVVGPAAEAFGVCYL